MEPKDGRQTSSLKRPSAGRGDENSSSPARATKPNNFSELASVLNFIR